MNLIEFIPHDYGGKDGPVVGAEGLLEIDIAQPKPAGKILPDWYKHLPAFEEKNIEPGKQTAKSCRPLYEYLQYGYILPLWCDYIFHHNEKNREIVAVSKCAYGGHPSEQTGDVLKNSNTFIDNAVKFINPWTIRTPPGYSCLFMAPFYNFEERFTIAPAIVNTDLFHNQIHFPAFVNKNIKVPFVLEMGYPLIHIIPFKRDDWKSKLVHFNDVVKTKAFKSFRYIMQNKWFWQYKKFAGVTNKFK